VPVCDTPTSSILTPEEGSEPESQTPVNWTVGEKPDAYE
jgi:hypothetical protein